SPKSGEHDDQTAPIDVVASMAATVSGWLGITPATRPPTPTPSALRACGRRDTSAASCAKESRSVRLSSPRNTRASRWSDRRNRFSAKLSLASGKNAAPGMASRLAARRAPFSPMTPQKSQSWSQNRSGFWTLQAWRSRYDVRPSWCRRFVSRRNAMTRVASTRAGEGLHSGWSFITNPLSYGPAGVNVARFQAGACVPLIRAIWPTPGQGHHARQEAARSARCLAICWASRQNPGHESDTDGRHWLSPLLPAGIHRPRRHSGSVLVTTIGFKRIGLAFAALVVVGLGAIAVSSF